MTGQDGPLSITGGMQHQAKVGQIVAAWRRLIAANTAAADQADAVEERLWQLPAPTSNTDLSLEEQALSVFEAVVGNQCAALASFCEDMAAQAVAEQDLALAARLLQHAVEIYGACSRRVSMNNAQVLRRRGLALFDAGDFAAAAGPLAVALDEHLVLEDYPERNLHTAQVAAALARTLCRVEPDSERIDQYFVLACELFGYALGIESEERVSCLLDYADYEIGKGEKQFAASHLRKALIALGKRTVRDETREAQIKDKLTGLRS